MGPETALVESAATKPKRPLSEVSVRVETTERALTAYGGAELLREAARAVAVFEEIDACVSVKQRPRGLSEAEFVVVVAESIALGARCLDDLAVARAIWRRGSYAASGSQRRRPRTRGCDDHSRSHQPVEQGGRVILRRAFTLAGVSEVTLDFDSTYLFSRSTRRQGVDRTYKKGLRPASVAVLRRRLGRGGPLSASPRQGRRVDGDAALFAETLRRVPDGVAVRARLDSGFCGGPHLTQMEQAGVTYLYGVPSTRGSSRRSDRSATEVLGRVSTTRVGEVASSATGSATARSSAATS